MITTKLPQKPLKSLTKSKVYKRWLKRKSPSERRRTPLADLIDEFLLDHPNYVISNELREEMASGRYERYRVLEKHHWSYWNVAPYDAYLKLESDHYRVQLKRYLDDLKIKDVLNDDGESVVFKDMIEGNSLRWLGYTEDCMVALEITGMTKTEGALAKLTIDPTQKPLDWAKVIQRTLDDAEIHCLDFEFDLGEDEYVLVLPTPKYADNEQVFKNIAEFNEAIRDYESFMTVGDPL